MEILKGINIQGLGIYIRKSKTLIIGDFHIGLEEALRMGGLHIPTQQFDIIYNNMKSLLEKIKPKEIIINGDLKHYFGIISNEEWDKIIRLLRMIGKFGKIQIIKGNHDAIIKPITDKLQIPLLSHVKLKDVYVCHGDKIPVNTDFKTSKTIIIGHEHPAIKLRDGIRMEVYKCFLKGKYQKKTLIIMPSFNPVSEGSDILTEKTLSPFLSDVNISNFEIYIVGDKVYSFGKVKNVKRIEHWS